jgi:hypothetical protein
VYGGVSDFVEGGTDVTVDEIDLGTLSYNVGSNGYFSSATKLQNAKKPSSNWEILANNICEWYQNTAQQAVYNGAPGIAVSLDGDIWIRDDRYSDGASLKTALNGVKFCYEVVTPTTIATPPTDLKLLQGTNNLTTNGTTITLDYIPNNSIGDAVKASEEYTDRAVERVIPKAKLACFYEIFDESGTLYDATIPEDCNFFLVEYRIQNRIGSTLIKAKSIDFYIPVVVNVGGEQHWVEFLYNSIYHTIDYTSNVTTDFGVLAIYTI